MDYHVARNNQKLGVYPEADAKARLQSGEILSSDLVWCEGMPAWRPAGEVFGGATAPVPPPVTPSALPARTSLPTSGAFSAQAKPANYLVWSILSTLLCCLPLGIVSIIFAAQVDSKFAAGDYAGAEQSSQRAKMWAWIAFATGLIGVIAYFAIIVLFGTMGALGSIPQ